MTTIQAFISKLDERRGALIAGICLLSLLAAVLTFDRKLDTWGDNAEYIILARSILQGRWMQRINQPDSPPSHKFPFGFPLLLAGIEWLTPGNMLAMKSVVLSFYVMAILAVYFLMRRYIDDFGATASAGSGEVSVPRSGQALAVTLLTLLNPLLLSFSHQVMTEVPYLFVSLLALIALERATEVVGRQGRRSLLAGLAFLCLGLWIRTVGLALFVAAFTYYAVRKEFLRAGAVVFACLAAMAIMQALGGGLLGSSYLAKVGQLNPDMPELGKVGLLGLAGPHRFLGNLQKYGLDGYISAAVLPLPSAQFNPMVSQTWIRLMSLGVVILLVAGCWRQCFVRPFIPLYSFCYFGLLLLAPARSASPRYAVPVVPFLLLFLMKGFEGFVHLVGRWLRRPNQSLLLAMAFTCSLALYLYADYSVMASSREFSPRWRSYFEAAEWLKEQTPPDSVVAGSSDHILYLVSQRRSIGFLKSTDPQKGMAHLRRYGADFVVVDETFVSTRYVTPMFNTYPEQFALVYTAGAVPTTYILRVRKDQRREDG